MSDEKIANDPVGYAEMAAPYDSAEDARAALDEFIRELKSLRSRCRIPEVLICAVAHYTDATGQAQSDALMQSLGSSAHAPMLGAIIWREYVQTAIDKAESLKKIAEGSEGQ